MAEAVHPIEPDPGPPWIPDDSTFGARLALIRQRMGWTKARAARECGESASTWGTWEKGTLPHNYEAVCRRIAERANCDLAWLLGVRGGPGMLAVTGKEHSTAQQLIFAGMRDRRHLALVTD